MPLKHGPALVAAGKVQYPFTSIRTRVSISDGQELMDQLLLLNGKQLGIGSTILQNSHCGMRHCNARFAPQGLICDIVNQDSFQTGNAGHNLRPATLRGHEAGLEGVSSRAQRILVQLKMNPIIGLDRDILENSRRDSERAFTVRGELRSKLCGEIPDAH